MNTQTMIVTFVKWFFIGQGVVWSCLTFFIIISEISIRQQGIGFAWVIAILFALMMTFVSNAISSNRLPSEKTNLFD